MHEASYEEIKSMMDTRSALEWAQVHPLVFYKDSKPYGLIAEVHNHIASTTIDPDAPFTFEMIRHLLELNKTQDIILITDDTRAFERVKRVLKPRGFEFYELNDILYSRRNRASNN